MKPPRLLSRGMFVKSAEYSSQIDNADTVELQFLNRCSPRGAQAQNQELTLRERNKKGVGSRT